MSKAAEQKDHTQKSDGKIYKLWLFLKKVINDESNFNSKGIAMRLAVIYILAGCLWILFSDKLLASLVSDKDTITFISMLKGWIYVVASGLLIYSLVLSRMNKIEKAQKELTRSEEALKLQVKELNTSRNELKIIHERYELAIDGSNDCIWDWDIVNDISYMSLKWAEILGLESQRNSKYYELWRSLVHPDDVTDAVNSLRAHLDSSKEYYNNEFRFRKNLNEYIWVACKAKILRNVEGKPIRMAGSFTDISKNKQIMQSLKESESKYRALFDNMTLGHATFKLVFDKDGESFYIATEVNNAYEEITGNKREDVIGKKITEVFSDENLERFEWKETFNTGNVFDKPMHLEYFSDIFAKWLALIVYRVNDGHIACIISDISERKFNEEKLQSVVEQLSQFEKLINFTSELIYISDFNGRHKHSNPAIERVLGYTKEEVQLVNVFDVYEVVHPEDIEIYNRNMEAVRSQGEGVFSFDIRYKCRDGEYKWLSWKLNPDKYSGLIYGVGRDITYEKRTLDRIKELNNELEERVDIRTKQLKEANKELEAFNNSISHDLRAPLRSIEGFSNILYESCKDLLDKDGTHYLKRILESTKRMNIMIDELLNLSRLGRGELKREEFNLSDLVRTVFDQISRLQPGRNVEIVIKDGINCYGDIHLIQIVLENLIGNSWKFTGRHLNARIEFGIIDKGQGVTYFIKDDGAGFDMGFSDKLFGTFQRLHSSKEFEGNGIGLANVQRIIKRHGGMIWAESAVEMGSVFYFTLGEQ